MIKLLTLLTLCSTLLWACKNDMIIPGSVVGSWKLKQQLMDPGDGSGTFIDVHSDKKITFNLDGTYSSNSYLCTPGTSTNGNSSGTYSEVTHILNTENCSGFGAPITYIIEDGVLIIAYPCVEACLEKFERI